MLFKMDLKFIASLLLIGAFMGMTAAQASCDPETQYEKGDQCCLMCGPGTSMSSPTEDCEKPRCQPCADDHYQDSYTDKVDCKRQPYCDENKNFEAPVSKSTTQQSTCKCKLGFHCSSKECITCVPHMLCQPGFGAKFIGNESQDTVCVKCQEGTFNNDTSWYGQCHKWTECETGYHVEERGTDTADNKCAWAQRRHIIVIAILSVVSVIAVVVLVLLYRAKCIKLKAKGYFEPPHAHEIPTPIETIVPMTPEENEDEPSHELSSEGFTEKGNQVMQERGKEEIVSRQESQLESQEDSQSMDQCSYRHN